MVGETVWAIYIYIYRVFVCIYYWAIRETILHSMLLACIVKMPTGDPMLYDSYKRTHVVYVAFKMRVLTISYLNIILDSKY